MNYIDGRTKTKHYCIEEGCNNEISYQNWCYGKKSCCSCANKKSINLRNENRRSYEGKNNPAFGKKGKNNPRYKEENHKKHYCIDCLKRDIKTKISLTNWRIGKRRCLSCARLKNWKNEDFKEKMLKASMLGRQISPNKPEALLNNLLNEVLPNEYKFVGDGKVILGGFCPDFINTNGQKKIIELYGDYWHNLPERKKVDKRRIKTYNKLGFNTLIIWQHELKDLELTIAKLMEFNI